MHLLNPHKIATFQLINLGALYPARLGDSLSLLAARFRSDLPSTLVRNSALQSHVRDVLWQFFKLVWWLLVALDRTGRASWVMILG